MKNAWRFKFLRVLFIHACTSAGWHGGLVDGVVTSQQGGAGFDSQAFLCGVCMFFYICFILDTSQSKYMHVYVDSLPLSFRYWERLQQNSVTRFRKKAGRITNEYTYICNISGFLIENMSKRLLDMVFLDFFNTSWEGYQARSKEWNHWTSDE